MYQIYRFLNKNNVSVLKLQEHDFASCVIMVYNGLVTKKAKLSVLRLLFTVICLILLRNMYVVYYW